MLPNSKCHGLLPHVSAFWLPLNTLANAERSSYVAGLVAYCMVHAAQVSDPGYWCWPSQDWYHYRLIDVDQHDPKRLPSEWP